MKKNNKQVTLSMTKGLPASGKSTWAKEQCRKHGAKRINKDDLRKMIDDGIHTKKNEKNILSVRNALVIHYLLEGLDVIVDDTNLNPIHEQTLRGIAEQVGAKFIVNDSFLQVSLEECLKRDAVRQNYVGEATIKKMYRKYISPTKEFIKPHDSRFSDCIIVDIDGTIAKNDNHRDWYDYSKVYDDKVNHDVLQLIDAYCKYYPHFDLFFVTGREGTEICIRETQRWLKDKVLSDYPSIENAYANIYFRTEKDFRPDHEVKNDIWKLVFENRYNIQIVFDDRKNVVDMWRSLGLRCMQVADGDF